MVTVKFNYDTSSKNNVMVDNKWASAHVMILTNLPTIIHS